MALEIGGGISIGGGITFQEDVAPVILPNTMTIANDSANGSFYYGADPLSLYGGMPSMLNSDLINAVLVYFYDNNSPSTARIYLKQGLNSGHYVDYSGSIDGDSHTYPRTFIVAGTSYTFVFDEPNYSYVYNGNLNFPSLVGETIGIEWDGNSTTPLTNSVIVSAFEGYGQSFFGASKGKNHSGQQWGPVYGTVYSTLFNEVAYYSSGMSGSTRIILNDGVYSGFTVSSGFINNDNSSSQVFKINGTRYSFNTTGSGSNASYIRMGDVGMVTEAGTVRTVEYDPNNQGGDGHTASGTITPDNQMSLYGAVPGMMGSINLIPEMLHTINYDMMQNTTYVIFKTGTYYGGIVVDDTAATIDGQTDVTITIDNRTNTGTLQSSNGGIGPSITFTGNPFLLTSMLGTPRTLTIDVVVPTTAVTYLSSIDYSPGAQMPPGVYIIGPNPSNNYSVYLSQSFWYISAGFEALHSLTTGDTFDVTMPLTGGTVYTITLLGAWQGPGPDYWTDVSSSSPLSLPGGSDNAPSSVIISTNSGPSGTSIAPTYTAAPWVITYSTSPLSLNIWYNSMSDAQYVAASTAVMGNVVSFSISGTEYRAIINSVSTSTNNMYGPMAYTVTFWFSGAASGYTMPPSSTPDSNPVLLYTS